MDNQENKSLIERLLSDKNIYLAIYYVNSYIQNKELLSKSDLNLINELQDVFSDKTSVIKKVREKIKNIIDNDDEYFSSTVFFKPKRFDNEINDIIFRPLHTSALIDQIAMVSMLQVLVYDVNDDGKLVQSDLSRLIPENFYGNRIDHSGNMLFKKWQEQYHEYISKSNEHMYLYSKSKKYKYEVNLDLENFFPSINPIVLSEFIYSKIPLHLAHEDVETLKKIITKLCYFKLNELNDTEVKWYYDKTVKDNIRYAKGIPQGLPHSYFFANLFMLLVKEKYQESFPGEMFFYVDDSVIFTNGKEGIIKDEIFKESILNLNESLKLTESNYLAQAINNFSFPIDFDYSNEDFGVKVHSPQNKSCFYNIEQSIDKSGELYLHALSRETSNLGFDMYTSFSDEDALTLERRTKTIIELIESELQKTDQKDFESYKKKLIRYKKYFSYRNEILEYRNEDDINALYKKFNGFYMQIFNVSNEGDKRNNFFAKFNDDILSSLLGFVLKKSIDNKDIYIKISNKINQIIQLIYGETLEHSYMHQSYVCYYDFLKDQTPINTYKTICDNLYIKYHTKIDLSTENKYKLFERITDVRNEIDLKILYTSVGIEYMLAYDELVINNSNELLRMILNAVFSYCFGYIIEDSPSFAKRSHDEIEYSELRILCILRNKNFEKNIFTELYDSFVDDEYKQTIDYSLLQVIKYFLIFVKDIKKVDNLILIHKYCCDTWKNGSKYLYFYTLHNQEHAVSLIKSSIQIIHKISYFNIKKLDYYILFAACYLHDISMVSFPNLEKFCASDDPNANKIYTDLISDVDISDSSKTKKVLCETYQKMDLYFEDDIRSNHAKDSANEIRKYIELNFLEESDRELIARVSQAHGYDSNAVYGLKSSGSTDLINEKLICILLRLCDLLDISRYRISKLILNHNLENINSTSRFHWLSHLVTDGYNLVSHYSKTKSGKNFLSDQSIVETISLTIDVFISQTTKVKKNCKCKYIKNAKLDYLDKTIKYKLDIDEECNEDNCNYLCKWFVVKNNYLFDELSALKTYLNSVSENYYNFDIEIILRPIEKTSISDKEFDYLTEYLDRY